MTDHPGAGRDEECDGEGDASEQQPLMVGASSAALSTASSEPPIHRRRRGGGRSHEWHVTTAFRLSWAVNWLLLVLKVWAFAISRSKSVLASTADSAVDLASQFVISAAEGAASQWSAHYPVGRSRLEALAVILCACIMSVSSLEVVQFAALDLYYGLAHGQPPELDLGGLMYAILAGGTVLKAGLWWYCRALAPRSDSMAALAEDHLNDVGSAVAAMIAALLTSIWTWAWWSDPVGAILISLVIIWRWSLMTWEQVRKLVGHAAPLEFHALVTDLANGHHSAMVVDVLRAYHHGSRYNVELEVVLPPAMSVRESHDLALELQHRIEALEEVERAFVHVDYEHRHMPEHKVERALWMAAEERRARREASSNGGAAPTLRTPSPSGGGADSGSTPARTASGGLLGLLLGGSPPGLPPLPRPRSASGSSGGGGLNSVGSDAAV